MRGDGILIITSMNFVRIRLQFAKDSNRYPPCTDCFEPHLCDFYPCNPFWTKFLNKLPFIDDRGQTDSANALTLTVALILTYDNDFHSSMSYSMVMIHASKHERGCLVHFVRPAMQHTAKRRKGIHSARTDWAPAVLVSLQPIKLSWRCRRAWPMNASCNWVRSGQVRSVQSSSCAC